MDLSNILQSEIDNLCRDFPAELDYIRTFLSQPGKRFRPQLYLDFIILHRQLTEADFRLAAGLEFLHLFFLVHDDIMDGDELRRGEKTIHFYFRDNFGDLKAQGIGLVIGDLLFAKAQELIISNLKSTQAQTVLFEAVNKTARGQFNEYILSPLKFPEIPEQTLLKYYQEKTALYSIYLPLALAYLEIKSTGQSFSYSLEDLLDFSSNLGVAFQLRDDLIEFTGEKIRNTDSFSADLMRGKLTPILLSIIQGCSTDLLDSCLNQWQSSQLSKENYHQLMQLGQNLKVADQCRDLILQHKNQAIDFASVHGLNEVNSLQNLFKLLSADQ